MCLIVLALDANSEFSLVLVTNRDEFYDRPTAPMHWWPDLPVLGGRDQRSGGTWLALRRNGSLALVTNYRSGTAETGKRSRGEIPLTILEQGVTEETLTALYGQRRSFSGFNLLAGNDSDWFYSGSEDTVPYRRLHRGIYGLSNQLLQSDWPKVNRSRRAVQHCLERTQADAATSTEMLHQSLIDAFHDESPADDDMLPDTGVGLALERLLSPLFIRSENYGTRATTVITVNRHGQVDISEQQYGRQGLTGIRQRFSWSIEK